MKRGEVYWADLVPRSGSEQQGRRPVIVVSHDAFNQTQGWRSIIVVPLSTSAAQGGVGPRLAPRPLAFEAFSKYVRNPSGQMPPYTVKVVSSPQLTDIYAFLRSVPEPPSVDSIPILKNN